MRVALACLLTVAAATLLAQSKPDDLYQRVRERVLADVARLPNYTCVQSINRRVFAAPKAAARRCGQIVADREARQESLPLISWDRLRLDVAIADKQEVFSWVGAARFEERGLHELVGEGQTDTGSFGSLLLSIFEDHTSMPFQGERKAGGRTLFEYSYDTPKERSHYEVRVAMGQFITAYHGSVFLDPETGDVARVTAHSAELYEGTGYCQVVGELDYGRVPIGSNEALIPREARSWAVARDGGEMLNINSYAGCRAYVGESVLRFGDPDAAAAPATSGASSDSPPPAIPSGLMFECRIVTPLDSGTSAAGDPVEAVLRSPIRAATGKVLAAAGAHLHGRLARFTGRAADGTQKASYEIGIQFLSIELGKTRVPFSANLAKVLASNATESNLRSGVGLAVLFEKDLHLRQLDSKWMTATPDAKELSR
jgi:hypothetical protein